MADGSAATPGSSTSKAPAIKDKECLYCHQAFTSSSLGRHLDLYIKERNAKPPDDLHNVEEIRRMRGNVTRRQARTSAGKREGSTHSSPKPTPFRDQRSPSIQGAYANIGYGEGGPVRTFLNKPNWQTTGVINDLPPVPPEGQLPFARRRSPSRRISVKEEITHKQNALEERDRARAAELALQEVLGSVRAASIRAHPPAPFDFNFFCLSFPELCLQCLSAPDSLLARSVVPDRFTWSFEAPKYIQHDLIREWLGSKLKDWQQQRNQYLSSTLDNQSNGTNGHSQNHFDQDSLGEVEETYFQHLSSTYESWKALPDKHKQEIWRAECAKAFAREQEKHKETTSKLELAEQEIQHLRAQLSQRSPYDPGSDYSLFPNSTLPISRATSSQLPNPATWNSESLISTWRARIQHQRSVQQPLPPPSPWATATPPNLNNSDHRTNGTMPLPHPDRSSGQHRQDKEHDPPSDDDEDLADAPGDEDTFGQEQELEMERGVLDPDLRGGERSGGGGDVDGEGGRMLMGLRDHTDYGNAQGGIGTGRV